MGCVADGAQTFAGLKLRNIYIRSPAAAHRLQRSFQTPYSAACRDSLNIPGQRHIRPRSSRRPRSALGIRQNLAAVRPAANNGWCLQALVHSAGHTASAAASNAAEAVTANSAGAPHIGSDRSDVVTGDPATTTAGTAKAGEALGSDFDWRSEWYPVSLSQNLPEGEQKCACLRAGSLNTPYISVVHGEPDRWISGSELLHKSSNRRKYLKARDGVTEAATSLAAEQKVNSERGNRCTYCLFQACL